MEAPRSYLYTKTGDSGQTSLYDGSRHPKIYKIFDILGQIDKVNVLLSKVLFSVEKFSFQGKNQKGQFVDNFIFSNLEYFINIFMDIASEIATPSEEKKKKLVLVENEDIKLLEKLINYFDSTTPKLKSFIIPYGPPIVTDLHLARVECRELERELLRFASEKECREEIKKFINRFSDYCFALARFLFHHTTKLEEKPRYTLKCKGT